MNSKVILGAAGGIAAAAIVLFFVMGSGGIRFPGSPDGQNQQPQLQDLQLSVNDIKASRGADNKTANLEVSFNVHNPNRNTAILESIHYNVYIGDLRMTSGDIGSSPQGFLASQEGIFPVVSNTTLLVKDTRPAVRTTVTAAAWDSMLAGDAQFRVEGFFAYKLTGSGFQFSAGEKDFVLTHP